MLLNNIVDVSAQWLNICCSSIDDAVFPDSIRNRVSGALFHLSLEHHGAIHILATHATHATHASYPHYGSAFALFRPQFEAFVRGVWYCKCASEKQLQDFISGNEPPTINVLIGDIEKLSNYSIGGLAEIKKNIWSVLCSYTHGGSVQVASFNSQSDIKSNFSEDQVYELFSKVCAVTLMVIVEFMTLLGKEHLNESILNQYNNLFCE